jgi:rare lipoprotein A (peptidoglycan hydrolase)
MNQAATVNRRTRQNRGASGPSRSPGLFIALAALLAAVLMTAACSNQTSEAKSETAEKRPELSLPDLTVHEKRVKKARTLPHVVSRPHDQKRTKTLADFHKYANYYEVNGKRYYPLLSAEGYAEIGEASWYGRYFHGKKTANGEIYNMHAMTAAHRTLPFNTFIKVTNLETLREVVLRINDRGPFDPDYRIIDLSFAAAKALGMVEPGYAEVKLEVLKTPQMVETQKKLKRRQQMKHIKKRNKQALTPQSPPPNHMIHLGG